MSCLVSTTASGTRLEYSPVDDLLTLTVCPGPVPSSLSPAPPGNLPISPPPPPLPTNELVYCAPPSACHGSDVTALLVFTPRSGGGTHVITCSRDSVSTWSLLPPPSDPSSDPAILTPLCTVPTTTSSSSSPPPSSSPAPAPCHVVLSACQTCVCLLFPDSPSCEVFILNDLGLSPWGTLSSPSFPAASLSAASFLEPEPDLLLLLLATNDGRALEIFDVKTRSPVTAPHSLPPTAEPASLLSCLPQSASSSLVAAASPDGSVLLFKLAIRLPQLHLSTLHEGKLGSGMLPLGIGFFESGGRAMLCVALGSQVSAILDCQSLSFSYSTCPFAQTPPEQITFGRADVCFPCVYKASAFLNATQFERLELPARAPPRAAPRAAAQNSKSLIATSPPPQKSPLSYTPAAAATTVAAAATKSTSTMKTAPQQTLRATKSSGYGTTQPQMKLGVAPSAAAKQHKQQILKRKRQMQALLQTRSESVYPTNCGLLTAAQPQHTYCAGGGGDATPVPIAHLAYHPLATHLCIVKTDSSVEVKALPFSGSSKKTPVYIAPPANASAHPSTPHFSSNLLAYHNCVYDITKAPKSSSTSLPPVLNLGDAASHAAFYYSDKFLLSVADKNVLKLHPWGGGGGGGGGGGSCRPIASYEHSKAHQISAVACINTHPSHLVFTATTDRTLRVIDVSTGGDYWSVPNAAGSRKCHALALPSVAASSALPPETYNLIAAASVDGGGLVSLWDIRAASPAALFKGHVNRIANCNVAFSPCMRYISVGSEDAQGAATYDLRMGGGKGACCRTKENRGVKDGAVVDVQYNPIFPQLATASLGGIVKFYSEAKEKDVVGGNGRGGGGERELPMDTGMGTGMDRELGMEQTGFD